MAQTTDEPLLRVLEQARELGFLGPGPVVDHLEHARAYLPALPANGRVADLGTGGGVPGIPLAFWRRDLEWLLVDAMAKRIAFVREAVATLDLDVSVEHARLEELAKDPGWAKSCAGVVARSVAAPSAAAEYAAPLLEVGGSAVIAEPPGGDAERWPAEGLALLGMRRGKIITTPGATLQVLEQVSECPSAFPRRVGLATKRPLF